MIIGEPRESPEVDSPAFGELQSAVANQQAAIVSSLLSTGGVLGVASGGTGSTSSSAARSALGAAPNSAAFITAQAESELSAEQSLGALTTGLLKNTVSAGVGTLSAAVTGVDYLPPYLASVSVNLNTTVAQDVYTVPAGKTLIALIAIFRAPSVNISGVALGLDIRDNSANVFWTFDNSGLTGNTKYTSVLLGDNSASALGILITATNKVQAKCASAFGSAATATIDLTGYLV